MWNQFKYWTFRNIGPLSDVAKKHRSVLMFLSVLLVVLDPGISITFGSASFVGLGLSVSPPQNISIGIFLLILLLYRVIAFWTTVLIDSGTDESRAHRKAVYDFDPGCDAEEPKPHDYDYLIRTGVGDYLYKWNTVRMAWEILVPNLFVILSVSVYFYKVICM